MNMGKISAVYKIVNTATGDFYIGSSKNVKDRWKEHKKPSTWKRRLNSPLYQDMQKYGVDCFSFEILEEVAEPESLKQVEQDSIELLNPTYNDRRAKGWDVERRKAYKKKYDQSGKGKESHKKYSQSDKGKESQKKYNHQLCEYNGETLTLNALSKRFRRAGIEHPTLEAKKYLM